MKTILVIYTDEKITDKKEISKSKKYSFNTNSKVKEGDIVETDTYDTNLQIVKVLSKAYKYFNSATGKLSNDFDSTTQWEIRTLQIRAKSASADIIWGSLVK